SAEPRAARAIRGRRVPNREHRGAVRRQKTPNRALRAPSGDIAGPNRELRGTVRRQKAPNRECRAPSADIAGRTESFAAPSVNAARRRGAVKWRTVRAKPARERGEGRQPRE